MGKKAKTTNLIEDQRSEVNVTSEENHALIQCKDIRLITSTLKPLILDESRDTSTRFAFRVRATVEAEKAYSYLEVKVNHFFPNVTDELAGLNLSFVLMGTFNTQSKPAQGEFADFIKMYTISILWPYAREYATDQFRRAGNYDVMLPIINPQVVTKHVIENNLVEVTIVESPPHTKKQVSNVV